ncbi:MAG: HlyD family efflux transporter periplasmic adaptor subunit [Planctomycetota bacterium]
MAILDSEIENKLRSDDSLSKAVEAERPTEPREVVSVAPVPTEAIDDVSETPIAIRSKQAKRAGRFRPSRTLSALAVVGLAASAIAMATRLTAGSVDQPTSPNAIGVKRVRVAATPVRLLDRPELNSSYRGIVIPRREAELAFRRSGRVSTITVEAGDRASKGQVLGTLEVDDLRAQLELSKSELAVAESQYEEALAGPRTQEIEAARSRVEQLTAQLRAAQQRLSRREQLVRQSAASAEELENERFEVARLAASVNETQSILDQLREGTRTEQIAAAKSRVAMAEAAIEVVRVQIADSKLVAPFECIIGQRFLDEGVIASPEAAVLSVIETPPLEARFGVPSQTARTLSVGDQVAISVGMKVNEAQARGFDGRIIRMQPRVDPVTRTREVVVQFDSKDVSYVGEPATLLLPWRPEPPRTSDGRARIWIPSDALVRNVRGLWGVYLIESTQGLSPDELYPAEVNGDVVMRDAKVIRTAGLRTLVEVDDIGEQLLITKGVHRIGPGTLVAAVTPDAPSAFATFAEDGVRTR